MPAARVATTPNILLLMVDQMRFDAMGCAGHPAVRTPGLDRLAAEGVRFTQAYTPVPICIAARHSVLTGQRCATHGRFANNVPDPEPALPTLPQLLGLAGYTTHAIGKMHFRPVRRHFGFHAMDLMEEIPDWRQDDDYLRYLDANGYGHIRWAHGVRGVLYLLPQVSVLPERHHGSTWVADRTIDFLARHRDRPFFCWSSWIAPHPPWNAPEPFASMYDPAALPPPAGWDRDPATLPPGMRRPTAQSADITPDILRRVQALYYGQISLIDKGVGRILRALDELDLARDTLVIFTSDHGEMLGDQRAFGKSLPYEPSAHIPLLVRLPGRTAAGRASRELVSLLDLLPTALDLARLEYPGAPPLPGASLLGAPGGGLAAPRDRLVIEFGRGPTRWLAMREGQWRYARYPGDGWEELYDLAADPTEQRNLLLEAGAPAAARAEQMRAHLDAWERQHGFAHPAPAVDAGQPPRFLAPTFRQHSPRWVFRLPPDERACLEPTSASLTQAIRHESMITTDWLRATGRLQRWADSGGDLPPDRSPDG